MRKPLSALAKFLEPYDPAVTRLFLAARKAVLNAAPDANELIYDAYNAVTIAYSFTPRLKEAFCHVAAYAKYVNLGFNRGTGLEDPEGRLAGSGAHIRHVRIDAPGILKKPAVQQLLCAAVEEGRLHHPTGHGEGQSTVKAIYARKRRL